VRLLLDTHASYRYIEVAQLLVEGISIVSADSALDAYGVTRLW
jgi:PIN domain nuclease of toxin-antitoxin system